MKGMKRFCSACLLVISVIVCAALIISAKPGFCGPPFMDFEGVGGGGIVPGAYLVNPPKDGKRMGDLAISHWSLIGEGNELITHAFAFSFLGRFEVGYALEINNFKRLRRELRKVSDGTMDVKRPYIYMHNFHFKTLLLKESLYVPAFAITTEFKYNETIADMNDNLGGALETVGYDDNKGVDFDFSFSKTIKDVVCYPLVINANIRLTRGHYLGLLGFSDDYSANFEYSSALILRPSFAIGAEIRQQNDEFDPLPFKKFTMKEEAFWDINLTWLPNKHFSAAIALCRYGNIVNKDIDFFVFNAKYDF